MAEGVNVRFFGELQRFIQEKTGELGVYSWASEYIRDLVSRD
jgi:Arc/MetJ-type ribon-helix-helix transcriptional regulator